jgi:RNA polymerase subunit RPABC4/transcription elongation factor Spt4
VNKSNVTSNAATKADANCDSSAIHVQRQSTEGLLGILCEDCSFMSPSSSCCYVHSVDVTHHWANWLLFVLHAANKSNAASDTLGIFVQKEGAEGSFLLSCSLATPQTIHFVHFTFTLWISLFFS